MRISRTAAVLAVSALLSLPVPAQAATPDVFRPHSVTLTESALEGVHGTAPDATVRNVLTVTAGGTALRVRLGNPAGSGPLVARSVWGGVQAAPGSPGLVAGAEPAAPRRVPPPGARPG